MLQFRGPRPAGMRSRRRSPKGASAPLLIGGGILVGGLIGIAGIQRWDLAVWQWASARSISASTLSGAGSLCIADVHDGDTIRTCDGERVRIENIDAPEMPGSPKCEDPGRQGWCDFELGYRSRDALKVFLEGGPVEIRRDGVDRYGRTLATASVNGRDAGNYLVSQGLARPWE